MTRASTCQLSLEVVTVSKEVAKTMPTITKPTTIIPNPALLEGIGFSQLLTVVKG